MSKTLRLENFTALLNTKFIISYDEDHKQEVELIEATDHNKTPSPESSSYSLLFRGKPGPQMFRDGVYKFSSEKLGEIELCLFAKAPDQEGIYYEVIFN